MNNSNKATVKFVFKGRVIEVRADYIVIASMVVALALGYIIAK